MQKNTFIKYFLLLHSLYQSGLVGCEAVRCQGLTRHGTGDKEHLWHEMGLGF